MEWVAKGVSEHFKFDLFAILETSGREYITNTLDKLLAEISSGGIYYVVKLRGAIIGMGALRQIREETGEIKRMYIQPSFQGKGYGKALLRQLLHKAMEFHYRAVYLDSARFMTAAHHLYRSSGFVERKEYPETEVPKQIRSHWLFMEKILEDPTK